MPFRPATERITAVELPGRHLRRSDRTTDAYAATSAASEDAFPPLSPPPEQPAKTAANIRVQAAGGLIAGVTVLREASHVEARLVEVEAAIAQTLWATG